MGRAVAVLEFVAPWLALAIAFSPVIVDLVQNLLVASEDRITLLAPILLGLAWRGSGQAPPARLQGALALAMATILEAVGIAAASWSVARLALPLAVIGLARLLGRPPLAVALLALWIVPIPDSVLLLASPNLETRLASAVAAVASALVAPLEHVGTILVGPGGRFDLTPEKAGFALAYALSAIGWFSAARIGPRLLPALQRAVVGALLAFPLQVFALGVVGLLMASGVSSALVSRVDVAITASFVVLAGFWSVRSSRAARSAV